MYMYLLGLVVVTSSSFSSTYIKQSAKGPAADSCARYFWRKGGL